METALLAEKLPIVNVSSVPQRSPFRYPGGKTWFVPYLRSWLASLPRKPSVFVEPFAGGGIASLTAVMEGLVERAVMAELDSGVASVWKVILSNDADELVARIRKFQISREKVIAELCREPKDEVDLAFQTILKNRVQRGGILAPGASLVKNGENNRGVASRWYPETLAKRILAIAEVRHRIEFLHKDAFDVVPRFLRHSAAAFFVDPPYTAGGKSAGSRLYVHNHVNHPALFELMTTVAGNVILTYDDSIEVYQLSKRHRFFVTTVPMKNTHHSEMWELAITNRKFEIAKTCASEERLIAERPPVYGRVKNKKVKINKHLR